MSVRLILLYLKSGKSITSKLPESIGCNTNIFTKLSLLILLFCCFSCWNIHRKTKSEPANYENKMTHFEKIEKRKIRRFALYKNGILGLLVTDQSGPLISTAGPAPEGYPMHPFLSGQARYTMFEDEIRNALESSQSFDEFIEKLLQKNYDAISIDQTPMPDRIETAYRIYKGKELKGFIWNGNGQSSTLHQQPEEGQFVFNFAAITLYDESAKILLTKSLPNASSFDKLITEIKNTGYTLQSHIP